MVIVDHDESSLDRVQSLDDIIVFTCTTVWLVAGYSENKYTLKVLYDQIQQ